MSAAVVIVLRVKRVFQFLRERGAVSPASAIPESDVPYSDRWYYRRVVAYGAIRRISNRCYLNETLAQAYLRARRRRGLVFATIAVLAFGLFWLAWALIHG